MKSDASLPRQTSTKPCKGVTVRNVKELQSAIEAGKVGTTIALTAGVFELPQTLSLKSGTTLCGQGAGKTIVRGVSTWQPSTDLLPRTENPKAYLFEIDRQRNVTIRDMSLHGPNLHGAVYGNQSERMTLAGLEIKDFLWSGARTFSMTKTQVHDNHFIDAGGKYKNTTGGALYDHYPKECNVWNNRVRSSKNSQRPFYGFKGRGGRNCRFHHNDIRRDFAIEYPFDNNIGFEIDRNYIEGTISIPKAGGGPVLADNALSFHIHRNVITKSYAIEFARNNVRIDRNLFDLDPKDDRGNLISDHGKRLSSGPLWMHDNLIRNVGRGIFWSKGAYNRIQFVNNHVRASKNTRNSPFFQLPSNTDFQTIQIERNIFECAPNSPRPLLSVDSKLLKNLQNNTFVNVLGMNRYARTRSNAPSGPKQPLQFTAGVNNEIQVNGWSVKGLKP
ncbi:hypothetical protein [Altericista sp. CCNU0014]|uniref:hypothetical protein n=1 Tax=Altericista sp. CCNU0014 TaxID=3082949 RepID=UPI00384B834A